jgi:hypothetical protein
VLLVFTVDNIEKEILKLINKELIKQGIKEY